MEKNFDLPDSILLAIEDIKTDNKSSSITLTKKSAEIFFDISEKYNTASKYYFNKLLYTTVIKIVKAQSCMASIINLSNRVLLQNDLTANVNKKCRYIRDTCNDFLKNIENNSRKIAQFLINHIKNNSILITHSYSSTVYDSLIYLFEKGKRFSVICTESRPMFEGVDLAKKLGEKGINVNLVADSAIFSFIQESDMVIVGCDSICKDGIVNKIGTKALGMISNMINTKFYCLCGFEKIIPFGFGKLNVNERREPKELLKKKLKNVKPINFYFDLTPFEYFTRVFTDMGMLNPDDLIKKMYDVKIHDILR
jgi:translation initiation factor eIF-2B subunit delta